MRKTLAVIIAILCLTTYQVVRAKSMETLPIVGRVDCHNHPDLLVSAWLVRETGHIAVLNERGRRIDAIGNCVAYDYGENHDRSGQLQEVKQRVRSTREVRKGHEKN